LLFGPVAQLGERTVRIRKVVGSNPFRSTKKIRDTLSRVSYFFGSLISFVHPKGN
jgi:hypothetical protein